MLRPPKKISMCFSANVGRHFFKIKQRWAPVLPGFSGILPRYFGNFAQIFSDFAQIFRDFARIFDKSNLLGVRLHPCTSVSYTTEQPLQHSHRVNPWFLTGRPRPPRGRQEISRGARALPCATTWKAFERECVLSKRYASANFTPLYVIWFSSGRDGSRG